MIRFAVLITCHNRKEKTLRCLKALFRQNKIDVLFQLEVFLVDDGSTDGTSNEIIRMYPQVNIISGDGNLFWNRGMHLAWKIASESYDYDYYIWLNDDSFLFKDALFKMTKYFSFEGILVGTLFCLKSKKISYGGFRKKKIVSPYLNNIEIDSFNGNCVIIPRHVFVILGNLNNKFHHALGDIDYGLRAKRENIKITLFNSIIGICNIHDEKPIWVNEKFNLLTRIKNLYSPISGLNPREFFYFERLHFGFLTAIFHFITIHFRLFFPVFVNKIKFNNNVKN